MKTITISENCWDQAVELSLALGIYSAEIELETIVCTTVSEAIKIALDPSETTKPVLANLSIEAAIAHVTEYDASDNDFDFHDLDPMDSDVEVADPRLTSWHMLQELNPADILILEAKKLGEAYGLALADVYARIDGELWGTMKARSLWSRQCELLGLLNQPIVP
jgi:hypothetical protein